jgi:hypothetical protein
MAKIPFRVKAYTQIKPPAITPRFSRAAGPHKLLPFSAGSSFGCIGFCRPAAISENQWRALRH